MSVFYENLIRCRKALKMSQDELSERSGVSQQAISMIEAGKRSPTEFTMKQLARGLGLSLSDLLGNEQKNPTAGSGDGIKEEIMLLMRLLPEEALPEVRDFVAWLKARHEAE
jgi:transcriptional regulator with XRE-family HTH domain